MRLFKRHREPEPSKKSPEKTPEQIARENKIQQEREIETTRECQSQLQLIINILEHAGYKTFFTNVTVPPAIQRIRYSYYFAFLESEQPHILIREQKMYPLPTFIGVDLRIHTPLIYPMFEFAKEKFKEYAKKYGGQGTFFSLGFINQLREELNVPDLSGDGIPLAERGNYGKAIDFFEVR